MRRAIVCLLMSSMLGCGVGTRHTVKPPAQPDPRAPLDVGPIVDEQGTDLGPVVAERLRERGLADAHYIGAPNGDTPYVDGRVRASDADRGGSGSVLSGSFLLGGGITSAAMGSTFLAIGQDYKGNDMKPAGAVLLSAGIALTVLGIWFLTRPSRYMSGTMTADLDMRRGASTTPFHVEDKAIVRHGIDEVDEGGRKLLDGVVDGVCVQTQRR